MNSPLVPPPARHRAFTLVELLVVIGIIALLISILLPTLNSARQSAKRVASSSNLRQIALGAIAYAGENGGSFNWGLWRYSKNIGYPDAPAAGPYQWTSTRISLAPFVGGGTDGTYYLYNGTTPAPSGSYGGVWESPLVTGEFNNSQGQYAGNSLVFPDRVSEVLLAPPYIAPLPPATQAPVPAKQSGVYSDTAIFWEAPAISGYEVLKTDGTLQIYQEFSGVDYFNIIWPSHPDVRYFFEGGEDPNVGDPDLGLDYPVSIIDTTNAGAPLDQFGEQVADPSAGSYTILYNAPIFHANNCNMAFADGSVRGMKAYRNQRHPVDPADFCISDFVRRNLRIKYPSRYWHGA